METQNQTICNNKSSQVMDSIIVQGKSRLVGEIEISGSKNASLPLMTASLLTDDALVLTGLPKIADITTMKQLLVNHGTKYQEDGNALIYLQQTIQNC